LKRSCSPVLRTYAWAIGTPPPQRPRQRSRPPSRTG
jgi:hypothetical protein